MIFACDGAGKKVYCNQRYLEYTGYSSYEEIDHHWLSIVHPEDRDAAAAAWRCALETGKPYVAEHRMRRHDGVYRHHLARAAPTLGQDGKAIAWVGTITDIDENKSKELLPRAEKRVGAGRRAAALAHEINNPLTTVTNALYLALKDEKLCEATRQYLELADREVSRLAAVAARSVRS